MPIIQPFKAILPNLKKIKSSEVYMEQVKTSFRTLFLQGFMQAINHNAIYIYRVIGEERSHTGLIACTHVKDFMNQVIKGHENTLEAKEERMKNLLEERQALIKPVLLFYKNVLEIDALINRIAVANVPILRWTVGKETHIFWEIKSQEYTEVLVNLFANAVDNLYIADGHHRVSTAIKIYEEEMSHNPASTGTEWFNYILSALFPASELDVHNFNRLVVKFPQKIDSLSFLEELATYFVIEQRPEAYHPAKKHYFGLYIDKKWYKLVLREKYIHKDLPIWERLDVHIFNEIILKQILQIKDVRTSPNIDYVAGTKGLGEVEKLVNDKSNIAGFTLYPLAIEDLFPITNAGKTLPPKSTWFEPRMRSGLIAKEFS